MEQTTRRWEQWMGIALALIEDGMSQAELAQKLGWNPGKMHRLATGKQEPKGNDIFLIATAQDRPIDWYLYGPARPDTNRSMGLYLGSIVSEMPRSVDLIAS